MYIIGADRIEIVDHRARPAGSWHAVDANGLVLCTSLRAGYVFPALAWTLATTDGPACAGCVRTMAALDQPVAATVAEPVLSVVPAYPAEPVPADGDRLATVDPIPAQQRQHYDDDPWGSLFA